jgi:hypothetical protein
MIDLAVLRKAVIPPLRAYLGAPVIQLEQEGKKPDCPFATFKFTTLFLPEPGQPIIEGKLVPSLDGRFEYDREETYITMPTSVLSITTFGKTSDESHSLAMRAYEWFFVLGRETLRDAGIVVVNQSSVLDRTVFLQVSHEHRHGFDVTLRVTSRVSKRSGLIESIQMNMTRK